MRESGAAALENWDEVVALLGPSWMGVRNQLYIKCVGLRLCATVYICFELNYLYDYGLYNAQLES